MSNEAPKPGAVRIGGLGPKAQKLQALRDKMAQQKAGGAKQNFSNNGPGMKSGASAAGHKKTNFQRKAT